VKSHYFHGSIEPKFVGTTRHPSTRSTHPKL
jgi:hypothetical protein